MNSWVDPVELNSKRQKTAAPSKSDSEGLHEWDKLVDHVKDSQDTASGSHAGGVQESNDCTDPALVDVVSIESTQVYEDGPNHCVPTSEIPPQQRSDWTGNTYLLPKERLLAFTHWKGKQSQASTSRHSIQSIAKSGRVMDNALLHQQKLKVPWGGVTSNNGAHALKRFQSREGSPGPNRVPLAVRLQELVQQAQDPATSTGLPYPQFGVQELAGETGDSDMHSWERFQSELSLHSRAIPLAVRLEELVQNVPPEDPSTFRGKKVEGRQHPHGKKSAVKVENDLLPIEDDIMGSLDSGSDLQDRSVEKSASQVPAVPTTSLWERFEEALQCAPPVDIKPTIPSKLSSKKASSGLSERLQSVIKTLKKEQAEFEKSLTSGQSLHGHSKCLVVLILKKKLEAQLTTCECEILQPPSEWNDCNNAMEGLDKPPMIDVIFSKMSGDLELEVGRVVRVHPPWFELNWKKPHGVGKLITGTFFCEMVDDR